MQNAAAIITDDELDAEFENVRLVNAPKLTLASVRAGLPVRSLLGDYLDDFKPGGQSQWLSATLTRQPNGYWLLAIRVPSLDETGEFLFTQHGASAR